MEPILLELCEHEANDITAGFQALLELEPDYPFEPEKEAVVRSVIAKVDQGDYTFDQFEFAGILSLLLVLLANDSVRYDKPNFRRRLQAFFDRIMSNLPQEVRESVFDCQKKLGFPAKKANISGYIRV